MSDSSPINLALCGHSKTGKSALSASLAEHAGVLLPLCVAETSAPIVPMCELARKWLLRKQDGLSGSSSTADLIAQGYSWLNDATRWHYGVPADAFMRPLSEADALLVAKLVQQILMDSRYLEPEVTVDNKSTHYPLLLAAISVPVTHLAVDWLQQNGQPELTNIWPDYADYQLRRILSGWSELPLQILSGLRLPGDDAYARKRGAYLVQIVRPGLETSGLVTDQVPFTPDLVVYNDGTLLHLYQFAKLLWRTLQGEIDLGIGQPGDGLAVPLSANVLTHEFLTA